MVPTWIESKLLNHGIKVFRFLYDCSVPILLQEREEVLSIIGQKTLTAPSRPVRNNHQVLYAMSAEEPNPPFDRLHPAFRKTMDVDRKIYGIFAERNFNFIQWNHDRLVSSAESQIIFANKRGNR